MSRVQSLLITAKGDDLRLAHLAICTIANDVSRRGDTVHYKVMPEDWERAVAACRKANVTTQTITDDDGPEIYPLLHQGPERPVWPLSRWVFHWCKIIPIPLFAWLNDDRTLTYKGGMFNECSCAVPTDFTHWKEDWQWQEIGALCSFPDLLGKGKGVVFHCGNNGELKRFDTEAEAEAYADEFNKQQKK